MSNAVTAMEVWLLACMMLVFFSLVEYTIILRRSVAHNRHLEKMKREANYIKASNNGVKILIIFIPKLFILSQHHPKYQVSKISYLNKVSADFLIVYTLETILSGKFHAAGGECR